MNYKKIILGALAYFISSFVIQGLLGFALAGEYFSSISIFRETPIIYLALLQTVLSGIAFAALYPATNFKGGCILRGLKFGSFVGVIVVPFLALDIPARFMMPTIEIWILAQGILGMLHYMVAGILVGIIYRERTT